MQLSGLHSLATLTCNLGCQVLHSTLAAFLLCKLKNTIHPPARAGQPSPLVSGTMLSMDHWVQPPAELPTQAQKKGPTAQLQMVPPTRDIALMQVVADVCSNLRLPLPVQRLSPNSSFCGGSVLGGIVQKSCLAKR